MLFSETTSLHKIRNLKKRLKIIQGGSSAGKTIAILLLMINKCQTNPDLVSSVVSESFPHIKRGSCRDFLNIMEGHGYYNDKRWNRTDYIYTFETGSRLEFFSADMPAKVRGPRRNGDLFINEANNVSYETYTQLAIRTEGDIYIDYNPVAEFWVHDEIMGKGLDNDFIILTYKDNEKLSPVVVQEIESRMGNKNFWDVYGRGELGASEGRIYKDWQILDELPFEAKLWKYGLDFGYTNDPSAGVAVYQYNGGYILDEVLYQKGLQNSQIAEIFKNLPRALIIADSAEPKSIDEIMAHGLTIIPSVKGKDSVNNGIAYVQDQKISVTKRSVNLIKEYRNYLWLTDREGKFINEPSGIWDHCMSALRYALAGERGVSWKPPVNVGGILPFYQGMPG